MLFRNSKQSKRAIKISFNIALHEIPRWLELEDKNVQPTKYEHHRECDLDYQVTVFPQTDDMLLYWHKTAGDFSDSIRSRIELDACYRESINWTELCPIYGSPIVEIEWWNDQLLVVFR